MPDGQGGETVYHAAGQVISAVLARRGLPKQLCHRHAFRQKKQLLALVTQTLRYKSVIDQLLDASALLKVEKRLDRAVAMAVVHDLAVAKCGVQCGGSIRKLAQRHGRRLEAERVKLLVKGGVRDIVKLLPLELQVAERMPRWARINKLKGSACAVIDQIRATGFRLVPTPAAQIGLQELEPGTFTVDPHLPDVVAFAPGSDLHANPLYLNGTLILQDKASCMPAHAVDPPRNAVCIDACAAPGNKTSHLAALMGNSGKIFAFDTDSRRLDLLRRLTGKAGASCIVPRHGSFLDVDVTASEFSSATHFLVDPSCSGSGMSAAPWEAAQVSAATQDAQQSKSTGNRKRKRGHRTTDRESNDPDTGSAATADIAEADRIQRVTHLADFQVQCVLKAMSFPAAQRVSYSTCSVYEEENESVVARVLAERSDWTTMRLLPCWPRRGILPDKYDFAPNVLRADRLEDGTTGFFVAAFVRTQKDGALQELPSGDGPPLPPASNHKRKRKRNKTKRSKKVAAQSSSDSVPDKDLA